MAQDKDALAETRRRQALDEELVPLVVAARVAYFHVTEAAHQVTTQSELLLVAIALSTIAPVIGDGGALSAADLRERLYGRRPSLDEGLEQRLGAERMPGVAAEAQDAPLPKARQHAVALGAS
jgi:hypothetical protein